MGKRPAIAFPGTCVPRNYSRELRSDNSHIARFPGRFNVVLSPQFAPIFLRASDGNVSRACAISCGYHRRVSSSRCIFIGTRRKPNQAVKSLRNAPWDLRGDCGYERARIFRARKFPRIRSRTNPEFYIALPRTLKSDRSFPVFNGL